MRILHVFTAMAPSYGWVVELANGLCGKQKELGHEVTVVATNLDWDDVLDVPLEEPVSIGNIDVHYFPIDGWARHVPVRIIRRFAISSRLRNWLRDRVSGFEVVHVHAIYLYPSLVASSASRKAHVPYVISPYGNLDPATHSHSRSIKSLYVEMFERRDLNGAAAIHFMSVGEQMLARGFGMTAPSTVIDLGLPSEKFEGLPKRGTFRSRYPALADKQIIMYLGRISYSKGLDVLAAAFVLVAKRHPDAHLMFVGPDRED
ncbi:MAG: glycosyltransferase, partial [Candidatus Dormibacterales bacterium]